MPYYTPTGNPLYLNRGVSLVMRNEFILIQGAFGQVLTDISLRGLIAGQVWTGAHDFTGAVITVPTQAPSDNSTKAASTAYADAAVAVETARAVAAEAVKANLVGPNTFTGTQNFTGANITVPNAAVGQQAVNANFVLATLTPTGPVLPFVPGATYIYGDLVFSLINLLTYRHLTPTSSLMTDPADDPTNWVNLYPQSAPALKVFTYTNFGGM